MPLRTVLFAALWAAIFVGPMGGQRTPASTPSREVSATVAGESREATAVYYSTRRNGRRTANGERFHSNALTAAHKTYPLGTRLRVTNLANNRRVVVRVNDRGPFTAGRDISVTRRAAQQLGFVKEGWAQVRLEVVGHAPR